jgi:hypothetical protein
MSLLEASEGLPLSLFTRIFVSAMVGLLVLSSRGASPQSPALTPLWKAAVPGSWLDVAAADLDGDGRGEILALAKGGRLHVLSRTAQPIARHPLDPQIQFIAVGPGPSGTQLAGWTHWGKAVTAYRLPPSPSKPPVRLWKEASFSDGVDWVAVGDLTGTSSGEVLVGTNGGSGLHLLNARGRRTWVNKAFGNCWNVALARDAEGARWALSTSSRGDIHFLDGAGKERWTIFGAQLQAYYAVLAVADLNGDGADEILALNSKLDVYGPDRRLLWQQPLGRKDPAWAWRRFAFPRADARRRLVVLATGGRRLRIFNDEGTAGATFDAAGGVHSLCSVRTEAAADALLVAAERSLQLYRVAAPRR